MAVLGFAFIARVTLVPTSGSDIGVFRWCLLCGDTGLSDFIANVILFVPVAVALCFWGASGRRIIGGLFLLSLAIELAQLRIPGRESTLSDVISNTLGAVVGVALASWWPRRRRSAPGAFIAVAAVLAAIACGGAILRPRFPSGTYYGQWDDYPTPYQHYGGRVLSAEIGGTPLPWQQLRNSQLVRKRLRNGDTVLVRGIAGLAPRWVTQWFGIGDERRRGILLLGVYRDELVFKVSTSAPDLLLREPELYWAGALDGIAPGDTIAVAAWRGGRSYCLRLNGRLRRGVAYAADELWQLIGPLPGRLAGAEHVVSYVFMALLGLPLGLLAPRRWAGGAAAAVLLMGVALVPWAVGLAPITVMDLAAVALGIAAGALMPLGGAAGSGVAVGSAQALVSAVPVG